VRPNRSQELQQSTSGKAVRLGGGSKVESGYENSHWTMSSAFESPADVQLAFFMVRRGLFMRGSGI